MPPFTFLCFRNLHFFMFKMHFLKNYSMYNNEIWQCDHNILVHNPVKQITNIRFIIVMESKCIKNFQPKKKEL